MSLREEMERSRLEEEAQQAADAVRGRQQKEKKDRERENIEREPKKRAAEYEIWMKANVLPLLREVNEILLQNTGILNTGNWVLYRNRKSILRQAFEITLESYPVGYSWASLGWKTGSVEKEIAVFVDDEYLQLKVGRSFNTPGAVLSKNALGDLTRRLADLLRKYPSNDDGVYISSERNTSEWDTG